jgi:hypothetical protein
LKFVVAGGRAGGAAKGGNMRKRWLLFEEGRNKVLDEGQDARDRQAARFLALSDLSLADLAQSDYHFFRHLKTVFLRQSLWSEQETNDVV